MLDILIIGSGPAGLSAAIYGKRAGFEVQVMEKMPYSTGQIAESSQVDNYLGFWEIDGFTLGSKFREHATSLGVQIADGDVTGLMPVEDGWQAKLADGSLIQAKTIIYAAGATHRHLGIPGEQEFSAKGVSYCATCDGAFFRNKKVAVIGGGDTALNDALYLADICEHVYVVHRRAEFRGAKQTLEKLEVKANVTLVTEARPKAITGDTMVQSLELEDGRVLEVSGVFVAVGMEPQTQILKNVVELDESGYVVAGEDCVANVLHVEGISAAGGFFVAGDVRTKPVRQVATAVADGALAVASVEAYLR